MKLTRLLYIYFGFILFALATLGTKQSLACASCGSGGMNPLVLYPNEQKKILIGLTRRTNLNDINVTGQTYRPAFKHQDQSLIAAGIRLTRDVETSFLIPFVTNRTEDGRQFSALSDPTLSLRWTIVQQTFAVPSIPQWQLTLDHRAHGAASVLDHERIDGLDAVGSGFNEWSFGTDVWWGIGPWKYGFLINHLRREGRYIQDRLLQRGSETALGATVGHMLSESLMLTTGIGSTFKSEDSENGQKIRLSNAQHHDVFAALRYTPNPLHEWRMSVRQAAVLFNNFNTTRSHLLQVSYAQIL